MRRLVSFNIRNYVVLSRSSFKARAMCEHWRLRSLEGELFCGLRALGVLNTIFMVCGFYFLIHIILPFFLFISVCVFTISKRSKNIKNKIYIAEKVSKYYVETDGPVNPPTHFGTNILTSSLVNIESVKSNRGNSEHSFHE